MATVGDPFAAHEDMPDLRRHAPATERNRDVIAAVLEELSYARPGLLLELASGTGQHAAHIAPRLPHMQWQPSDIEPHHLASITAWRDHVGADSILDPLYLDLCDADWAGRLALAAAARLIFSANLIHIAPPEVAQHMLSGAPQMLSSGDLLVLYGPFKIDGAHVSESNMEFEQWLKSKDPRFGLYDTQYLRDTAAMHGLSLVEQRPMPAHNFTLIFERQAV